MRDQNKEIAVIGSGIMGSGIAQVFVQSGYNVMIYDKDIDRLTNSFDRISKNIKKWCQKVGKVSEENLLNNFNKTESIEAIRNACFVIEAVTEKLDIKQAIFSHVEKIVSKDTIIASNTSGISIGSIAEVCHYRERVIGTHFFNPPVKMPLVEVISGKSTSLKTIETTKRIIASIDKTPVLTADVPGFIVNRIITPMLNQAMLTYEQGIASKENIDKAMKKAMGHPMGPLELADYIGLDTLLFFMEDIYAQTGDYTFKPTSILKELVHEGKVGVKSGAGFYNYSQGETLHNKKS